MDKPVKKKLTDKYTIKKYENFEYSVYKKH